MNLNNPLDREQLELRAERSEREREINEGLDDLDFVESACEWFDERDQERGIEANAYLHEEAKARRREQHEG